MDQQSECEHGNHDADDRGGHEVAAQLEQAVTGCEKFLVSSGDTVLAGETVNHREEVDGRMHEQEKNEESTTDGLDKLPADGGFDHEHNLIVLIVLT